MGKLYKVYEKGVCIVSLLTIVVSAVANKDSGYGLIGIIPASYLVCFLLARNFRKYSAQHIGLYTLDIIMFVKYVLTNLSILISEDYTLKGYYVIQVKNISYYVATILIVVELVSIFILVEFSTRKMYSNMQRTSLEVRFEPIQLNAVAYLFIGFTLCLIAVFPNDFFENSMIIFSKKTSVTETIETNNVLSVIFKAFNVILMCLFINNWLVRYQNSPKFIYIFLSYATVAIFTFLSISTSRRNMLIPFVFFFALTGVLFKKRGIILDIFICILLIGVFRIVSIYKNPWIYAKTQTSFEAVQEFTKGVQFYTSGIAPTAIGLQCIDVFRNKISLITLFNDIFGSIPLLSHLFDSENRIYTIYNMYCLGGTSNTQLIPMTVSSIGYFSVFFTPLAVLFNVYMLMKIESSSKKVENNYLDQYMNLYLYYIFASSITSNVQMLSGRFFVNYLPVAVLIFLSRNYLNKLEFVFRRK